MLSSKVVSQIVKDVPLGRPQAPRFPSRFSARPCRSHTPFRTIVTDYNKDQAYTKRATYTIFSTLERARSVIRKNNVGANVFGLRLRRPLHLDELVDSLNFLQAKHTKLQYQSKTILEGGGIYGRIDSALPVEVEEMNVEDSELQLQRAMDAMLRKPMMEHMLTVKAIYAPEACDLVVSVSNGAADVAASGMLVNELLQRYSELITNAEAAPSTTEIAPMMDELANIFPPSTRTSTLGWKAIRASMREYGRMAKAIQTQSPLRLSNDPSAPTFLTLELSTQLTATIEKNALDHGVDVLSAFAAAVSLAARDKLFKLPAPEAPAESINVDLWINHDLRIDGFQPHFPNNTMTPAEVASYHCFPSGTPDNSKNIWELATEIYNDSKRVISNDMLFDMYHFSPTAASVKARGISSVPAAPFIFQDAQQLSLAYSTIENLGIEDVRFAETAQPGTCKLVISRFAHKLQLSFNYPSGSISSTEVEVVTDAALDMLRG